MPTYDYLCKKCGHRFEAFQRISEEALTECPECQGPVKRLISGGNGLIFKGSGFYITDYKNGNSSPAAKTAVRRKTKQSLLKKRVRAKMYPEQFSCSGFFLAISQKDDCREFFAPAQD